MRRMERVKGICSTTLQALIRVPGSRCRFECGRMSLIGGKRTLVDEAEAAPSGLHTREAVVRICENPGNHDAATATMTCRLTSSTGRMNGLISPGLRHQGQVRPRCWRESRAHGAANGRDEMVDVPRPNCELRKRFGSAAVQCHDIHGGPAERCSPAGHGKSDSGTAADDEHTLARELHLSSASAREARGTWRRGA